ncbi:thiamine pyrophosphate-binding protein [Oryzibacter oryziterrae]|uniref:thiamine pyrophosphate-binding protein n=1 Tax=Oryzibacter oryziterrae TaxID=2766474 RepID=UPI001F2F7553|nr:thiamine pyrophosphate-binding protein [Oryzibacter oryziterrae]
MTSQAKPRTGGQVLVDQLIAQGVERLTCVPGESYLAVLDALHDASIDVMICRNEGGAAMMADAYGKLTGKLGICFVTRGPGAMNAAHGVHIAAHDSTPMVLFIGQAERGMLEREAFQEMDYKAVFGSVAKWVVEINLAERIPELIARAFRVALQGRPGPVVISLPEDMLLDTVEVADAPVVEPAETWPGLPDMVQLQKLLWAAKKPLVILGGTRWTERAQREIIRFAERFDLPVTTGFRRASLFPADHPNYAGDVGIGPNPKLAQRVKDADLLIVIGSRMSEMPSSSYTLIGIPTATQTLVHIHPDPQEIGRVYQPALGIIASPHAFASALSTVHPPVQIPWSEHTVSARADFLAWTEVPLKVPGDFQYGEVMVWLRNRMPPETIVCNGAGNYAIWLHRYWRHKRFATQVAPTSGSVGYSIPAGVMAKRQNPDKPVVVFAGDGCFLMNGAEFATAVQYDAPMVVIVVDNGMYGTIRMHQEREYPGRPSGTYLKNPDFAAFARAFGGHGETVRTTDEFAPAFERALASGKPAIIHCFIDPQAITPARTLDQIAGRAP